MPRRVVNELRDLYRGQTAWIVGKGPSLKHLQAEHFGDGPVITMNEAIVTVQALDLSNPIYSLQKDGCTYQPCICKAGTNGTALVTLNEQTALLLQCPGYSELCFPMHRNVLFVEPEQDLRLSEDAMSIRMCAAVARLMGCTEIVFVCCDSLVTGDIRRVDFWSGEVVEDGGSVHYLPNNPRLLDDLGEFPVRYLMPEREAL